MCAIRYAPKQRQVYSSRFALDCETELIRDHRIPRLALVSISDGEAHYLLHPTTSAHSCLPMPTCPSSSTTPAFRFLGGSRHLIQNKQGKAAAAWMDLLRRRRLHNTMLLDMLVRLAEGTDNRPDIPPRDLGTVAAEYTGMTLDKESPYRLRFGELIGVDWATVDSGFFAYGLPDAIATARTYTRLHRRGLQLMEGYGYDPKAERTFDIDPAAISQFGVLTEFVQVGAAIALAQIEQNGIHADQARLARTAAELRGESESAIGRLIQEYPDLFKLDPAGNLKRTAKTGTPCRSTKALDGYLLETVKEIEANTGQAVEVPRTAKGQICKSLESWVALVDAASLP